jgi:hypothetical protein
MANEEAGPSHSLTGVWNGFYGYITIEGMPDTAFTAVVIDSGGALSCTIHEDALFGGQVIPAEATMTGGRHGAEVSFIKSYVGSLRRMEKIAYEGTLNATGDQIQGQWQITLPSEMVRGRFVMTRNRPRAKAESVGVAELEKV